MYWFIRLILLRAKNTAFVTVLWHSILRDWLVLLLPQKHSESQSFSCILYFRGFHSQILEISEVQRPVVLSELYGWICIIRDNIILLQK